MTNLEIFYDAHVDKLYKYFYVQCLNRHVAEDLTSQTFVAFVDKRQSTDIKDEKKYLYAIMRNVWAEYLRKKYIEVAQSIDAIDDFETYVDTSIGVFEGATMKERASVYIERLPDKQREVARMRLLEEIPVSEVAQRLQKNSLYVKTTQYRAIKNLRRMLERPEIGGALI